LTHKLLDLVPTHLITLIAKLFDQPTASIASVMLEKAFFNRLGQLFLSLCGLIGLAGLISVKATATNTQYLAQELNSMLINVLADKLINQPQV
jgi:hypothetical protein